MDKKINIGTRGSKLALWQAEHLKSLLEGEGYEAVLKIIKTQGDRVQDLPLQKLEGKGFFTKEIEEALLAGEIDVAVHSLKDLPTGQADELVIAGVSYREDPADLLIINEAAFDESQTMHIKKNAIVGTSSVRRKIQLRHFREDLELIDIRGNVPTRIKKLKEGNFDGIVLAAAGINRLEINLNDLKVFKFDPTEFISAPAQGVIAFQVRKQDVPMRRVIKKIHQVEVSACTNVERSILKLADGGCHSPLGAYCKKDAAGNFHAYACYASAENKPLKFRQLSYSTSHQLAEDLFKKFNEDL